MKPIPTLGLLLLVCSTALASGGDKDGFNLFKDYLRNGKEYDSLLSGEVSPKFLYFYRAPPSLLLPEGGGSSKRNQFWRSVGRKDLEEEGPQESQGAARVLAVSRPIAARTFLAKRDVGSIEEQRSRDLVKRALFSWPAEPRRPEEIRIKTAATDGY
ncbi:uncharacterized protein LOC132194804 [Neocloeon triangulifer]|uniref:uncharacterized protein LOC132194804 n=1 Tax=Neocloeon triangulifer TaxID=2078957 RepID=UPI00286EC8D3|nr:uncharacterized protein LOC132194804 [Neocloeon triangulifer]